MGSTAKTNANLYDTTKMSRSVQRNTYEITSAVTGRISFLFLYSNDLLLRRMHLFITLVTVNINLFHTPHTYSDVNERSQIT